MDRSQLNTIFIYSHFEVAFLANIIKIAQIESKQALHVLWLLKNYVSQSFYMILFEILLIDFMIYY